MNEWFARDTSKKVRAIKRAQGMAGKHTAVHPLYGYKKDPDDPEKWVIDDEAAEIVRRIFRMTINGKGPYEIATILEREHILCPSAYLAERGAGNRRNNEFTNPCRWWGNTVSYILNRMEYMGHTEVVQDLILSALRSISEYAKANREAFERLVDGHDL